MPIGQQELLIVARFKDLVTKEVGRLNRGFTRFASTATKAVGRVVRGIGRMTIVLNQAFALVGKVAQAMRKLGGLIAVPVRLAAEQERVEAKLSAVIRATGGAAGFTAYELRNMAGAMQEVTGIGDEVVINAQAILATFKSIKKEGDVFERALEVSVDLAELLEGDLQQSVIMIGKALEEPAVGLSALRRVGVSFTEDQVKLINTLVDTNQTLEAQGVILAGIEGQVGGLSRAMRDTFSGALRALNSEWGDLLETIGQQITRNPRLLSAMEAVIDKLREWKEGFFETGSIGERVQVFIASMIENIPDLVRAFGGLIQMVARFVVVMEKLAQLMGRVFEAVGDAVTSFGEFIKQLGEMGFGLATMRNFGAELSAVEEFLAMLAPLRGGGGALEELGEAFRAISGVGDAGLTIDADDSAFMALVKEIGVLAPVMAEELAKAIEKGLEEGTAKANIQEVIGRGFGEEVLDAFQQAWSDFGTGFGDAVQERLTQLKGITDEVKQLTLSFLDESQTALVDFFRSIRDETDSLAGSFDALITTLRQKLADMLLEFAANRTLQLLLEGVKKLGGVKVGGMTEDQVAQAENTLALRENTAALLSGLQNLGVGGLDPAIAANEEAMAGLEDAIAASDAEQVSIWQSIGNGVSNLANVFWSVGSWLFSGLMNIISAIGVLISSGSFSDAVSSFVGFSGGGAVNYLASGGMPAFNPRGTDTVPAMLTPGEFVMRKAAVQAIGIPRLEAMNRGGVQGFANGGLVGGGADGGGVHVSININAVDARGVRDLLTSREGKEAITGVIRRGIATSPQMRRQIGSVKK
jgi:hypothetical protein